ncbi:MAG TPA: glycosyltransferase family 2 protein [Solirubrobacterales bacterium]|nr:glycosyltransferase family 2 protein [Solirubrobacterales bacterium]
MEVESLGVVVLAYGGGRQHEGLLEGLLAEGVSPAALLVVHNPAAPGESAPPLPAGVELLETGRNLGYAGGMNRGIAHMRERGADPVLLLTHDARLRPGALAALLEAARRRPEYGVLAPALVFTGSDEPFSYGGVTRGTGTNKHVGERPAADGVFACDWVDGGTMLIRKATLERAGGFDERFWGYCEEADLCLRVRRSGAAVGVVLDAVAEQAPGGAKRPGPWAYLLIRNQTEYARRAVGLRGVAVVTARTIWLVAFQLARALARGVGLRPGGAAEPWAVAVGTARGTLDWFRSRWGPPPADLPGMGDVGNA